MRALFDTNILIDHLRGIQAAKDELGRYREKSISIVTWMEVLVGTAPAVQTVTRNFLDSFAVITLDQGVAEQAVAIRRQHRIKLPDAIIWASAQVHGMLLVTRDLKGLPKGDPGVRMPYSLAH